MNTMTTVNLFRTAIAVALFGAASGFAAMPAVADESDAPQTTVKYGDLNISTTQGAAALYARIRSAAKAVCSQFDGPVLAAYAQRDACVNKAILGAVNKVNSAALTALYSAKTGKEVPTHLVSR